MKKTELINDRIAIAQKAIRIAGDYLLDNFHKHHFVQKKSDSTPLIQEDINSEEIIISTIKTSFPDDSFLSEESAFSITTDYIWIIDPLCGTYSYVRGVETWSLSIALVHEAQYLFGVVYQPTLKNIFVGQSKTGSTLNGSKIFLSETKELKNSFISIEHSVFIDGKVDIMKLTTDCKRIRVGHGSGAELSYVAAGYLDAVIKTDQSPEHYSGGRAIIQAAGGVFVGFDGKSLPVITDRNVKVNYIATNNFLAQKIVDYIHT